MVVLFREQHLTIIQFKAVNGRRDVKQKQNKKTWLSSKQILKHVN